MRGVAKGLHCYANAVFRQLRPSLAPSYHSTLTRCIQQFEFTEDGNILKYTWHANGKLLSKLVGHLDSFRMWLQHGPATSEAFCQGKRPSRLHIERRTITQFRKRNSSLQGNKARNMPMRHRSDRRSEDVSDQALSDQPQVAPTRSTGSSPMRRSEYSVRRSTG